MLAIMPKKKKPPGNKKLLGVWNAKKDALNLTQASAAYTLDFDSQSSVSEYIHGKIPLNLEAAYKFASLLKVTVGEIWDGACVLAEAGNISPELFKEQMVRASHHQRMEFLRIIADCDGTAGDQ